ncbi:hypothetical protein BjapCC829_21880 [Bradyrhizobium barranii]|uniref:Uncharacterized protein n=1 Tax=Bradyrhizobium barranii TaxID=2992140 RepID=A0ABY3QYD5_9BRAD|nr:hypothetical protein [Bradyrhizobium japonicum]UFW91041.1 hypothetical protein BjapCC829_21880 [Bradyrhizobium japonicum]
MTTLPVLFAAAVYGTALGLLPDRVANWWGIFSCLAAFAWTGFWWLLLVGLAAGYRTARRHRD